MSLADFFKKELQATEKFIGNLVEGLGTKLKEDFLPAVIAVVKFGQTVLNLDSADLIGDLAGVAGKHLEDSARTILNSTVPKLQACQQFINAGSSNDVLAATLKWLSTQAPSATSAFWIEFGGMAAAAFADGHIDLKEAITLINYVEKTTAQ